MKIKLVIAALAIVSFSIRSAAQLPHASIYVHALYASSLDRSSQNFYNGGFGGVAGVALGTKSTKAVGSIGYSYFIADKNKNPLGNESYIPVKIGLRETLPLVLHFLYLQGDIGVGFVSNKNDNNNNSRFAADIGAGAKFGALEAALMWDSFKEKQPSGWSSWITLQLGFNIGF